VGRDRALSSAGNKHVVPRRTMRWLLLLLLVLKCIAVLCIEVSGEGPLVLNFDTRWQLMSELGLHSRKRKYTSSVPSRAMFITQRTADHSVRQQSARDCARNCRVNKCGDSIAGIPRISREFLSGNCQYWHNLCALPTASLFCFRCHRQGFLGK
jgi:hypothetical protein